MVGAKADLSDLRLLDFNVAKRLTEGGGIPSVKHESQGVLSKHVRNTFPKADGKFPLQKTLLCIMQVLWVPLGHVSVRGQVLDSQAWDPEGPMCL